MKKNILKTLAVAFALISATSALPTPQELTTPRPSLKSRLAGVCHGVGLGAGASALCAGLIKEDLSLVGLGGIIVGSSMILTHVLDEQVNERLDAFSRELMPIYTSAVCSFAAIFTAFKVCQNLPTY